MTDNINNDIGNVNISLSKSLDNVNKDKEEESNKKDFNNDISFKNIKKKIKSISTDNINSSYIKLNKKYKKISLDSNEKMVLNNNNNNLFKLTNTKEL